MPCGQKKNPPKHKQTQYCNKFTEDFKNHPLGKKSLKKKKRNGQNWQLLTSLLIVKLEGYPTMMFVFGEAKILGNWEKLGGAPWHCTPNSPPLHREKAGSAIRHPWSHQSMVAQPFCAGCGFPSPGYCFVNPDALLLGFSPFCSFATSFFSFPYASFYSQFYE